MNKGWKIAIGAGVAIGGWYLIGLYQTIRNIDWQFSNFAVYDVNKEGVVFRLRLIIDNTTGTRNINVRGARFKFYFNGQYVATVRMTQGARILAGQSETMEFLITLRWLQLGRIGLDALSDNNVTVTMNGNVNVGVLTAPVPNINIANVNIKSKIDELKNELAAAGKNISELFSRNA